MKICLVTETFPPEINGVSMTLGRLSNCLVDAGTELRVIAPKRSNRLVNTQTSYTLYEVPGLPLPRYPDLRFGLPCKGRLKRLWMKERPDLIHIATEGPLGLSALNTATDLKIPVISSFHTNFQSYANHYGANLLSRAVLRWLRYFHNRCLRTYVPSEDVLQQLHAGGFQNLHILARGVDTELFGPHRRDDSLRKAWGANAQTPVAVYVGRIAAEKNLDLVVAAYEQMRGQLPDLKLVLVGDGPARNRLQSTYPQFIFAGMRTGEDLAGHYASADCFIFASITETFGNVVTEAMTSSLPVLAYDYAAAARFIQDGINGFTALYDDRKAFLDKAEELASARQRWREIGKNARHVMMPHSWQSIADNYLIEITLLLEKEMDLPKTENDKKIQETRPAI